MSRFLKLADSFSESPHLYCPSLLRLRAVQNSNWLSGPRMDVWASQSSSTLAILAGGMPVPTKSCSAEVQFFGGSLVDAIGSYFVVLLPPNRKRTVTKFFSNVTGEIKLINLTYCTQLTHYEVLKYAFLPNRSYRYHHYYKFGARTIISRAI